MEERTADDYRSQINEFIVQFGKERDLDLEPLNDAGVTRVQRGSAVVWIHCLPQQGVLLLLARVLDAIADEHREALFEKLLQLSYLATRDAAFAINDGKVYLRTLRQLDGLDYDEFEDLVHTVGSVADEWDDKLNAEFS